MYNIRIEVTVDGEKYTVEAHDDEFEDRLDVVREHLQSMYRRMYETLSVP
jgi:hypothetical protein